MAAKRSADIAKDALDSEAVAARRRAEHRNEIAGVLRAGLELLERVLAAKRNGSFEESEWTPEYDAWMHKVQAAFDATDPTLDTRFHLHIDDARLEQALAERTRRLQVTLDAI